MNSRAARPGRLSLLRGLILLSALPLAGQDSGGAAGRKLTSFTLSNGMRFVLLERHQSPVISFHTYIGGGFADDPAGQTGLARLVGKMSFKGSESVGSRNWPEEKRALEAADEAYERMEAERNKGPLMKQEQFDNLRAQWRIAVDSAQRLGDGAEFGRILGENGATDVRASGSWQAIQSGFTLASNKIELWFAMESQRLMHPVLREFEKEKADAVDELSKHQVDGQARVLEALLSAAFTAHPYRVPALGWPSDVAELRRANARQFVERHYVPGNIVIGMTGDIDPVEAKRLAEKYFGPMPARPLPEPVRTAEPAQQGPRTVELYQGGQFLVAIGYKRPGYLDKDDVVLDVLRSVLGGGTSGLAWRELVQEKKVAAALQVVAAYPEGRDTNLFLFFAAPSPGRTAEHVQSAVEELLGRFRAQKMGLDLLNTAKAQAQAAAYERLATNTVMAEMLAVHTAVYGDPQKLFSLVDDIGKVTEEDVLRVAQRYLVMANRTVAFTAIPGAAARTPRSGALQ